jgi:hypothetical protein
MMFVYQIVCLFTECVLLFNMSHFSKIWVWEQPVHGEGVWLPPPTGRVRGRGGTRHANHPWLTAAPVMEQDLWDSGTMLLYPQNEQPNQGKEAKWVWTVECENKKHHFIAYWRLMGRPPYVCQAYFHWRCLFVFLIIVLYKGENLLTVIKEEWLLSFPP